MTKKEHEKELRCYPAALTAAEVAEILRVSGKKKSRVRTQRSVFLRKLPKKSGLVR